MDVVSIIESNPQIKVMEMDDSSVDMGLENDDDEDIPDDVFDLFTFWMLKIWEYYKPCLLNDIVCMLL